MADVTRVRNEGDWAAAAARALSLEIAQALDSRPDVLVAVAGGRTPAAVLPLLALESALWARVCFVPTDDRLAPPGSDARNDARLSAWLQAPLNAGATLMSLEAADPDRAPDVVLLGFGADRHVASLFPAGEGMASAIDPAGAPLRAHVTPSPLPPEAPYARITFTMRALIASRCVVVAASGADKVTALDAALAETPPASPLAVLLAQQHTPVRVFVCAGA